MDGWTRHRIDKTRIQQLEKHLAAKKRQAAELQQQNTQLCARHSILLAYCSSLAWLRDFTWIQLTEDPLQQQQQAQQQQQFVTVVDSMLLASAEELQLLEQLGLHPQQQQQPAALHNSSCHNSYIDCPGHSSDHLLAGQHLWCPALNIQDHGSDGMLSLPNAMPIAGVGAVAAGSCGTGTISPDNDILALFRHVHALPPFPGAAHITMEELAVEYNNIVRELSLNLMLYEAHACRPTAFQSQLVPSDQLPLVNIKAAFDRYFNMITTMMQLRKGKQLVSIGLVNFENPTGGLLQEPNFATHNRAVAAINLSLQQQQQIAEGMAVFSRLLEPVLQELKELQLQETPTGDSRAAHACGNTITASTSDAAADEGAASSPLSSSSSGTSDCFKRSEVETAEHRERLHKQEKRTSRMEILMQKDTLIKAAFVSYTFGRFTYPQLAKLHCIMYPYNPQHATVVKAVEQQLEQAMQQQRPRQQQQQQQQQRPRQQQQQQQQQQQRPRQQEQQWQEQEAMLVQHQEPEVLVQLAKKQQQAKQQELKRNKKKNVAR